MTTNKERRAKRQQEEMVNAVVHLGAEFIGMRIEKAYIPSRAAVLKPILPLEMFDADALPLVELPSGFRSLRKV